MERERDIVKGQEGLMTVQLAELSKTLNNLETENMKLKNQSMIQQISENTWRDKFKNQGEMMQERERMFASTVEQLRLSQINSERVLNSGREGTNYRENFTVQDRDYNLSLSPNTKNQHRYGLGSQIVSNVVSNDNLLGHKIFSEHKDFINEAQAKDSEISYFSSDKRFSLDVNRERGHQGSNTKGIKETLISN